MDKKLTEYQKPVLESMLENYIREISRGHLKKNNKTDEVIGHYYYYCIKLQ